MSEYVSLTSVPGMMYTSKNDTYVNFIRKKEQDRAKQEKNEKSKSELQIKAHVFYIQIIKIVIINFELQSPFFV